MSKKLLRNILFVIGALLVVGGIVLMSVIVPGMRVFPNDVDTVRTYDLSYLTLLNAETMEFFRVPPLTGEETEEELAARPPLSIERNIFVEAVDGNRTLVRETQTLYAGETVITQIVKRHALDRKSMMGITNPPTDWTSQDGYLRRTGIIIGWGPEGIKKENYTVWSDDYRDTSEMVFVREEEHAGVNTYYFTSESEPKPIAAAHIAALGLPPGLPLEAVGALTAGLQIDNPMVKIFVTTMLPGMIETAVRETQELGEDDPVIVPLEYTYDYFGEYWGDPDTGVLIDTKKRENRAVNFTPEVLENLAGQLEAAGRDSSALSALLPMTINAFEYTTTEESIADAKKDAEDAGAKLSLFGTTLPIGMIAVGLLALLGGLYFTVAAGTWQKKAA